MPVIGSNKLKRYLNWNFLPYEQEIPQSDRFNYHQNACLYSFIFSILFLFYKILYLHICSFLGNPMDSVLQSSKAFVRDQRVFQGHVIEDPHMQPEDLDEDPTTVYYGGEVYSTNGLYVVNPPAPGTRGLDPAGIPSAVHDNYGYLPSPPPVPPGPPHSTRYLYPENAGHLVWTSLNLFGPVWEGVAAIWFEPRPLPIQDFFSSDFLDKCANYTVLDNNNFIFRFFMNFKNSIVKSWKF